MFPRAQIPHRLVLIDRWALKLARPTHSDSHLCRDQNFSPNNSHWQKQDGEAAIWGVNFVFLCRSLFWMCVRRFTVQYRQFQCRNIRTIYVYFVQYTKVGIIDRSLMMTNEVMNQMLKLTLWMNHMLKPTSFMVNQMLKILCSGLLCLREAKMFEMTP